MADIAIRITGKADQALREIQRVSGAVQSLRTQVTSAMGTIRSAAQMALTYLGARGLVGSLQTATQAALRQATAQKRLELALRQTGDVTGAGAAEIKRYAAELQKVTGVADEVTIQAAAQAVALTGLTGPALKQAIALSHDLAAVTGEGLTGAMMALSKALVDPADGLSRLRKAGIMLTEQQVEQIKLIHETSGLYAAQQAVLRALAQRIGGMAAATTTPMQILKSHIYELLEAIGTRLLPYVEGIATLALENLPQIVDWAAQAGKTFLSWVVTLAKVAVAWKTVTAVLRAYAAIKAFVVALTGKGLLLVAGAAVVAAGVYAGMELAIGKANKELSGFREEIENAADRAQQWQRSGQAWMRSLEGQRKAIKGTTEALTEQAAAAQRAQDTIKRAQEGAKESQKLVQRAETPAQRIAREWKEFETTYAKLEDAARLHHQVWQSLPKITDAKEWAKALELMKTLRQLSEEFSRLAEAAGAIKEKIIADALGDAAARASEMEDEITALRRGMSDLHKESWQWLKPLQAVAAQLDAIGEHRAAGLILEQIDKVKRLSLDLEAERVRQRLLSPSMRYAQYHRQITRLVRLGKLSPEEAVEALSLERPGAGVAPTLGALTRGGEFYRALAQAMASAEAQKEEAQWRKESLEYLRSIDRNTSDLELLEADI